MNDRACHVVVIDEPCEDSDCQSLGRVYRAHARSFGLIEEDTDMEVHFSSDSGLWVGGELGEEERCLLASELLVERDGWCRARLEPCATPIFYEADPFAPGFFESTPDAWLVSGGGDPSVEVPTEAEMLSQVARRHEQLARSRKPR